MIFTNLILTNQLVGKYDIELAYLTPVHGTLSGFPAASLVAQLPSCPFASALPHPHRDTGTGQNGEIILYTDL